MNEIPQDNSFPNEGQIQKNHNLSGKISFTRIFLAIGAVLILGFGVLTIMSPYFLILPYYFILQIAGPLAIFLFMFSTLKFIRGESNWVSKLAPKIWLTTITGVTVAILIGLFFKWEWTGREIGREIEIMYQLSAKENLVFIVLLDTIGLLGGKAPLIIFWSYIFLVVLALSITATEKKFLSGFLGGLATLASVYIPSYITFQSAYSNAPGIFNFLADPANCYRVEGGLGVEIDCVWEKYFYQGLGLLIYGAVIGNLIGNFRFQLKTHLPIVRLTILALAVLIITPASIFAVSLNRSLERGELARVERQSAVFKLSELERQRSKIFLKESLISSPERPFKKLRLEGKLFILDDGEFVLVSYLSNENPNSPNLTENFMVFEVQVIVDGNSLGDPNRATIENYTRHLSEGNHNIIIEDNFAASFAQNRNLQFAELVANRNLYLRIDLYEYWGPDTALLEDFKLLTITYETKYYSIGDWLN